MPDPNTNVDGSVNSRPSNGFGRWVYSNKSFKELVDISKDTALAEPPFKNIVLGGLKSWQNSGTYGTDMRLKLRDEDGWGGTSGYFTMTAGDGWQFLFYLKTSNNDWFDEQALDGVSGKWEIIQTLMLK